MSSSYLFVFYALKCEGAGSQFLENKTHTKDELNQKTHTNICSIYTRCVKKVYTFGGLWNKSMWLIIKTKTLIYQLKVNLDVKV